MSDRFDRRVTTMMNSGRLFWVDATIHVMDTMESVLLWCEDHQIPFTIDGAEVTAMILARYDQIVAGAQQDMDVE